MVDLEDMGQDAAERPLREALPHSLDDAREHFARRVCELRNPDPDLLRFALAVGACLEVDLQRKRIVCNDAADVGMTLAGLSTLEMGRALHSLEIAELIHVPKGEDTVVLRFEV